MPFGIDTTEVSLSGVPAWVWLILLIVGLLLCFFGEIIWEFMVSILGAIIGSMIGFAVGYAVGGYICALGLAVLFAIIGSMLFQLLAKAAVALLCALLAFGGVAYLVYTGNPDDTTTPIVVGLIVGVIVFVIAIMFVEEIVGVFLAAIGGFLVGVAVYFLVGGGFAFVWAVLAGGSMFVLGAVFQVMMQRQRKKPSPAPPRREPVKETRPAETTIREQPSRTHEPKPPIQNSASPLTPLSSKVADISFPSS